MIRMLSLLAMTAGLLALPAATVTAADPLSLIPADAAMVVRLKAPATTTEKVAAYADSVQPGAGRNVRGNAAAIGLAISNPTLAGVDQSADWLLTMLVEEGERPQVVFLIPATDAEAMTAALPGHMTSTVRDEWVIYSEDSAALEAFSGDGDSRIAATMGEAVKASFDKGDVSLYVNITRLTDVYAQQVEQLHEQATSALNQLQFNLANADTGMQVGPMIEMYSGMLEGSLQALKDGKGLVIAASIDETALFIEEFFDFESGSKTSNWLARQEGSDFAEMGKLPADAIAYYGFKGDMAALYEWGFGMTAMMLKDDDLKEQFEAQRKEMSKFNYGPALGSLDLASGQDGVVRSVNIVEVSPTGTFRQSMHKMLNLVSDLEMPGFRQTSTITPDAETINDHKVDVITVKQEYDNDADPKGIQKQMMEILFGPEGIVTRQVFVEQGYIQTSGGGKALMEESLARYDGSESVDYSSYREGMEEEPNLLVLLDLPGLAVRGMKVAATIPSLNLPVTPEMVQGMASPPSYLAFAIKAENNSVRCQTRLPAQQPQGIMRLVGLFVLLGQQIRQNGL